MSAVNPNPSAGNRGGGIQLPPGWQDTFCDHLRETLNIYESCKVSGVSRPTVYKYIKEDPEFAAKVQEAKEDAVDNLQECLYKRARDGVKQIRKFFDVKTGALIGEQIRTEFTDAGIKLIESLRPEVFRPSQKLELSGAISIDERQEIRRQKLTAAVQVLLDGNEKLPPMSLPQALEYLLIRQVPKEDLALVKGNDLRLPEASEMTVDIEATEVSGNGHGSK